MTAAQKPSQEVKDFYKKYQSLFNSNGDDFCNNIFSENAETVYYEGSAYNKFIFAPRTSICDLWNDARKDLLVTKVDLFNQNDFLDANGQKTGIAVRGNTSFVERQYPGTVTNILEFKDVLEVSNGGLQVVEQNGTSYVLSATARWKLMNLFNY